MKINSAVDIDCVLLNLYNDIILKLKFVKKIGSSISDN